MSEESLRERLEQLSEEELTALEQEKAEEPALWKRVLDKFATAIDPATYTDALSKRLERSAPASAKPSTPPTPVPEERPATAATFDTAKPAEPEQAVEPPEPVKPEPTKKGDVFRAQIKEVAPPKIQDFEFAQELDTAKKAAIQEELDKLQPNRVAQILAQGEKDLSKLQVQPEVYKQYKDTVDQAYQEYVAERDRIRKAELWSGLAKALGYLVMARFSNNTLAPNQFGWVDFKADRYLTEAKQDLDAKLGIAKSKLTEDQQAASEERQVESIRERERTALIDAAERDRLERKQDLLRASQALDTEAEKRLQFKITRQNNAIQAYNLQVQWNMTLANRAEMADRRELEKAERAQADAAKALEKSLKELQNDQQQAANLLERQARELPDKLAKALSNKKFSSDEKLQFVRAYLNNTKALSPEAKADILNQEQSWFGFSGIDKDELLKKVNTYIDQEVTPTIARLRAGQQPIMIQDNEGNIVPVRVDKFVDPKVQQLIRSEGWQVVPSY